MRARGAHLRRDRERPWRTCLHIRRAYLHIWSACLYAAPHPLHAGPHHLHAGPPKRHAELPDPRVGQGQTKPGGKPGRGGRADHDVRSLGDGSHASARHARGCRDASSGHRAFGGDTPASDRPRARERARAAKAFAHTLPGGDRDRRRGRAARAGMLGVGPGAGAGVRATLGAVPASRVGRGRHAQLVDVGRIRGLGALRALAKFSHDAVRRTWPEPESRSRASKIRGPPAMKKFRRRRRDDARPQ